jgi:chlorobactene glucosyltransferase
MIFLLVSMLWCSLATAAFLLLQSRYAALIDLDLFARSLEDLPVVAVIVPARNEVDNIDTCLDGLLQQLYPREKMQVIVIDDGSTDGTPQAARQYERDGFQPRVLDAGPLPTGWLGKSHACWLGANAVEADWLCFIDADTRHDPGLILSSVQAAIREDIDLLSLHPRQEMLGFWERLLMPIPFMTLMILLDAQRINDPTTTTAMANGQFILIKHDVYRALGGHAAIRDQVLEDVALARLVKSHGGRLKLLGGGQLIKVRMYASLKPLWQGLARSGSELFGVPLTSLAVLSSLLTSILPLAYPFWRISVAITMPDVYSVLSAVFGCLGSLIWYGAHTLALHNYRVPYRFLLLLPVSNFLIAIVNAEGIFRRLVGRRLWKGRHI